MRKSFLMLVAMALIIAFAAAPAIAGVNYWDPLNGWKMHWPQLPDTTEYGLDVNSAMNSECCDVVLADDWQCSESGYVKGIHFWGSWKYDVVDTIDHFTLKIYSNDPGPFSKPGQLLWQYNVPFSSVRVHKLQTSQVREGWYDPCPPSGAALANNHKFYYQYNVTVPNAIPNPVPPSDSLFWQQQGTIYWLSVQAVLSPDTGFPPDTVGCWGWKTSMSQHFMDDAVFSYQGGPWGELRHPLTQVSLDLAFVITGDPALWPEPSSLSEIGLIILLLSLAAAGILLMRRARRVRAV